MNNTLRTEPWRIVKFILITLAVNAVFTMIQMPLQNLALTSEQPGRYLYILSYGRLWGAAVVSCLLHRTFTFCASEKWYIALPWMLFFTLGWQMLSSVCMQMLARVSAEAVISGSTFLPLPELILSYLFQRCVIYKHYLDDNGWYRRRHPVADEEGVTPDE